MAHILSLRINKHINKYINTVIFFFLQNYPDTFLT